MTNPPPPPGDGHPQWPQAGGTPWPPPGAPQWPPPGGTPWPPPGGNPWPPQVPPTAPPPRTDRGIRWLVIALLVAIVGAYAGAVALTKNRWAPGTTTEERTLVTFRPAQDATASAEDLDQARGILAARVAAQGVADPRVTVEDDAIVLSVPGTDQQRWRDVGGTGRLALRPVVHAVEAQPEGAPTTPPEPPTAQMIADEKELRQSTDPSVQVLAVQFQASRCGAPDALVGRDDPDLPLVTCSRDGDVAYLLDKSIIDGSQIQEAGADLDDNVGWIVDVEFDSDAADRWADFTAANIGTQVAFTLDTAVVSAPEIMEAIPGGRTQITGDFTEDDARLLAATLTGGTLPFPLTVESSTVETVPLQTYSTAWRIGVIAAGVVVALLVVGGVLLLVSLGRSGRSAPPGYAADVTRYTS